jgi:hypothetical protein
MLARLGGPSYISVSGGVSSSATGRRATGIQTHLPLPFCISVGCDSISCADVGFDLVTEKVQRQPRAHDRERNVGSLAVPDMDVASWND